MDADNSQLSKVKLSKKVFFNFKNNSIWFLVNIATNCLLNKQTTNFMKIKYLLSIVLLLSIGTFSSCDLIEKADDVSFDTDLPLEFQINETAVNPTGKDYSASKLLSASTDPDVAKYASKIKEFKINRITYTISPGANPNTVTFTNGVLKAGTQTLATVTSASLSNTSEIDLTADTAGFNDLAAKLKGDLQEEITLTGRLSQTPVAFNVTFKFYVTVTANAL